MDSSVAVGLLTWLVPVVIISIISFVGWAIRHRIQKVDELENKVSQHGGKIEYLENTAVTAEQVRSILHQSNEPLRLSMQSLESAISEQTATINIVLQQLAERRGYEVALKELGERHGK